MADLVYISQSAGRLMRCLFEICLRRNWAPLAEKALLLCKAVSHRMWTSQNPLRQFKGKLRLPPHILAQLEKKELPWERCALLLGPKRCDRCLPARRACWCCSTVVHLAGLLSALALTPVEAPALIPSSPANCGRVELHKLHSCAACRYFDMKPAEIGELIRNPKFGKAVHKMISMVPRLQLSASIQPLTRNLLRIDLVLTPDFRWDTDQHGFVEPFLVMARPPACLALASVAPRPCALPRDALHSSFSAHYCSRQCPSTAFRSAAAVAGGALTKGGPS